MDEKLSELDQLRWERDTARAERDHYKADNERLRELLHYCIQAKDAEYRLRVSSSAGDKP